MSERIRKSPPWPIVVGVLRGAAQELAITYAISNLRSDTHKELRMLGSCIDDLEKLLPVRAPEGFYLGTIWASNEVLRFTETMASSKMQPVERHVTILSGAASGFVVAGAFEKEDV